jgi:uncharacterized glyoxalase superfamily protein PhnB
MTEDINAPSLYPTLRYADAPAAIRFLVEAFGFTEESVMAGPVEDTIAHAELSYGNGMLMLGSVRDDGGVFDVSNCGVYVAVDDPDAHHDRARAAGAEIVMDPTDQDYGSREYAAKDSEGNVWSFGTYRPAPRPR